MISRRIPGAVGGRPARTFDGSPTPDLSGALDIGLGATDPFFIAIRSQRVGTAGTQMLVVVGVAGADANFRGVRTSSATNVRASSANSGGSTANATVEGYTTTSGWVAIIGEFASITSRRILANKVAATDTASSTVSVAPTHIRIGSSFGGGSALTAQISQVALFSGIASDDFIDAHWRGTHPLRLPGQLLECWDLDRGTGLIGLVRGTVLTPVRGTGLAPGPDHEEGPPRRVWLPVGSVGGGGALETDSTAASAAWTAAAATAAPGAVTSTSTVALASWTTVAATASAGAQTTDSTAATAAWTAVAATAAPGAVTTTSTVATADWTSVAATATAGAVTSTATVSTAAWTAPAATAAPGAATVTSTVATAAWTAPAATAVYRQIARPASDVSAGTWTASAGSDLFAMVDDDSDSTYIRSGSGAGPDVAVLALGAIDTPQAGTVRLRLRHRVTP
jgi:hypothetical protein